MSILAVCGEKYAKISSICNVVIFSEHGAPIITKDGVTVAKAVELECPYENLGAQLCIQVSSKTNENAGDGTTTATVLSRAFVREGLKIVSAGGNPISIKRGIDKAVDVLVEAIAELAKPIDSIAIQVTTGVIQNNTKKTSSLPNFKDKE